MPKPIFEHTQYIEALTPEKWKEIYKKKEELLEVLPFVEEPGFQSLTPMQQHFILGYTYKDLKNFKWTDLFRFISNDYTSSTSAINLTGHRIRKHEVVQHYLEEVDKARLKVLGYTISRIIEEELNLAFSDITQYLDDEGCITIKELKNLPGSARRAIRSFEMVESGEGETSLKKIKITLWDKGQSLSRLQKIKGMQQENVNFNSNNKNFSIALDMESKEAADLYSKMIKDK